jgi:hypothetical protein
MVTGSLRHLLLLKENAGRLSAEAGWVGLHFYEPPLWCLEDGMLV